ncbi:hypothetical protein ABB27_18370 [Stenotrophomonas terrae]|uniref:Capsular biosynthesis protein n=1 Tax=Stenotrophomonas terrae TaxID=405446 RepID=A0A0R0BXK8_9GAMM|nr:hypothetical protein [Stenotrophomonas terrae]KRG62249.1 hypothetical protein ABB27_18370 [Stenotrophomonas terrae]
MHSIYLVDYRNAGHFFQRLIAADPTRTHHIISTVHSVRAQEGSRTGLTHIHLLSARSGRKKFDLSRTRERALGCMPQRRCLNLFRSVEQAIADSIKQYAATADETTIFVWNGATVMGEAARQFQQDSGCHVVFMEISNLPGKIFADPKGTNAQALLFSEPSLLNRFQGDLDAYPQWRDSFIQQRKHLHAPPQATTARQLGIQHVTDAVHALLFGYRHFSWAAALDKIGSQFRSCFQSRRQRRPVSIPTGNYVFFPMQVSSDTQLLLNSKLNNIQALEKISSECPTRIVIKPHPAEIDTRYIGAAIAEAKLEDRVEISDCNTTKLIEGADSVYTINSTVGLEAKILGKTTCFLAKSIYAQIDQSMLPNYVMSYLLDVDFFDSGNAPIPLQIVEQLHTRARLRATN